MDPEEKKWFVVGLVFTIIAGGGGVTIYIGIMLRMTASRMLQSSIISDMLMYEMYQGMGYGFEQMYLVTILSDFGRFTRMTNFFTIVMYIGIAICAMGGILGITGWSKYYQATRGKFV